MVAELCQPPFQKEDELHGGLTKSQSALRLEEEIPGRGFLGLSFILKRAVSLNLQDTAIHGNRAAQSKIRWSSPVR